MWSALLAERTRTIEQLCVATAATPVRLSSVFGDAVMGHGAVDVSLHDSGLVQISQRANDLALRSP